MNQVEQVNEGVQVAALFRSGQIQPLKFLWGRREYPVRQVNLAYTRFEGRAKLYFFAVDDGANFFKLQFNSDDLSWTLLEMQSP